MRISILQLSRSRLSSLSESDEFQCLVPSYRRRGSLPRFQSRGKVAKFSRSRMSLRLPVSRVSFVRGFVVSNRQDSR